MSGTADQLMCGAPTVLNNLIQYYETNDVVTTGDRDVRIATAGSAPATAGRTRPRPESQSGQ